MAIRTAWPVSHACGHTTTHDLSSKPADKRAGLARWLSHKDCTNCWRGKQADGETRLSKQRSITQQRAEESAAVADWEQQRAMPDLDGSSKARDWAARARHCLLRAACEAHVESGAMQEAEFDALIETPAKRITGASWWIDNRDTNPDDIPELLEAAKCGKRISRDRKPLLAKQTRITMTALTRVTFLAETRKFGDHTRYTQFSGRNFRDCNLSRLDLRTLNLRDSWLVAAHLDGADLTYTDLRGANLTGASVRGADLSGALIDPATTWHGAIADPDTQWPTGFSPVGSGVIVQFTRPSTAQPFPVPVEPSASPTLIGL